MAQVLKTFMKSRKCWLKIDLVSSKEVFRQCMNVLQSKMALNDGVYIEFMKNQSFLVVLHKICQIWSTDLYFLSTLRNQPLPYNLIDPTAQNLITGTFGRPNLVEPNSWRTRLNDCLAVDRTGRNCQFSHLNIFHIFKLTFF